MEAARSLQSDILTAARQHFADKGFYGTSLAAVAGTLGVTKQAVLHYFPTKEKLYAAVLDGVAGDLRELLAQVRAARLPPAATVTHLLLRAERLSLQKPAAVRLLVREMLDIERRAAGIPSWPLEEFQQSVAVLVQAASEDPALSAEAAFGAIWPLLGAIWFRAISVPALELALSPEASTGFRAATSAALERQIRKAWKAQSPH
ncbi:MAG: TetR family transcriptional regulator [Pseudomonadota bacterium]